MREEYTDQEKQMLRAKLREGSRLAREVAVKRGGKLHPRIAKAQHAHEWSHWKEIGRTGDWFHPLIVERKCTICGATETDEH